MEIVEIARALHEADCGCSETPEPHDEPYWTQAQALMPLVRRAQAEAKADMLDKIIDAYYAGEANRFTLSNSTIDWIRAQPEYKARYEQEVEHD